MENINLIETFSEFKELKNIDRATMMSVLATKCRSDGIQSARGKSYPIVAGCSRGKIVDGWFRQLERLVRRAKEIKK